MQIRPPGRLKAGHQTTEIVCNCAQASHSSRQFMLKPVKHQLFSIALRFSLLLIAGISSAAAADWPQFRGPNRDGVSTETGLLKDWAAGGPRLVWKATGLAEGFSTAVVAGGRMYTL